MTDPPGDVSGGFFLPNHEGMSFQYTHPISLRDGAQQKDASRKRIPLDRITACYSNSGRPLGSRFLCVSFPVWGHTDVTSALSDLCQADGPQTAFREA